VNPLDRLGSPPWAVYAVPPPSPGGRRLSEPPAPTRSDFQRDRDRIVHCTAFRRLVYKTQVFLNHEGDLFRTRLTHSLEVAQLGRSIARSLRLNEDLVEAISLAHDLGHTPFGHAGQDALNDCMADYGGFEHNLQSLRVVDALEQRYPGWDGLNLCLETREGILKRCPLPLAQQIEAREPSGVARRFLDGTQPSLEAQLCNLADEIAYNAHDIDDGVRSGLLSLAALREVPLFARFDEEVQREHPGLAVKAPRRLLAEIIRRMLSAQVYDVIASASESLATTAPASCNDVRRHPALIRFTANMRHASAELKRFLFRELYRHPQVMDTTERGRRIITELFAAYLNDPRQLPEEHRGPDIADGISPRRVADYIAGMTDRFATREHQRLTGRQVFLEH